MFKMAEVVPVIQRYPSLTSTVFQFHKEENSEKVLRRKIESLISKASADELQWAYRVLRALLEP